MNVGFVVSFSAGVASVLSPCVLPLIPIVVGHSIVKKELSQTASFVAGFFTIFTVITLLTVLFTAAINHYLIYFRIAASLLIIGVGMFFLVNKNILRFSHTPKKKTKHSEPFLMGLLTCLAWSPCYGPYIVAVAAYSASTGNMLFSTINMVLFAGGFSLTLFLVAFTASKINFEKIIRYSNGIRTVSGILIIIAGTYMLIGLI